MCGIVGYIGNRDLKAVLLNGLYKLEYRGYDSAGVVSLENNNLNVCKVVGKIKELDNALNGSKLGGFIGLGHTRWATHGEPNQTNAHPHIDCKGELAVVHNGIIENYSELKERLIKSGHVFRSATDTEVIAHLIEEELAKDSYDLEHAVKNAIKQLKGSYAVGTVSVHNPNKFVAARSGSPLVVGVGNGENFIASDVSAIIGFSKNVIFLDEDQVAVVTKESIKVTDKDSSIIVPKVTHVNWDNEQVEKNGYPHYMLKEINQQPAVIKNIIGLHTDPECKKVIFNNLAISEQELNGINRVVIQACGTSYHAGLTGKYLLEHFVKIPVEVDISSEFRYRDPLLGSDTLVIAISQSGETADTLAGVREAKSKKSKVLSICNTLNSSIARESDGVIYLNAGPEIGVASTKAYTAQVAILYLFSIYLAKIKGRIPDAMISTLLWELKKVPGVMEEILSRAKWIIGCASKYVNAKDAMYLGRGINYPSALEGALKHKEITYMHASGYSAGEMKHGPIALIDESVPIVCVAMKDSTYEKMMSNIQEVKARKGKVIAIATWGDTQIGKFADDIFYISRVDEYVSPLVTILPMQLLSYHTAVMRGFDPDKPRNLAKSVTVE
jgi:glucosamine--fructose-6-phosphate aminotransferase (isomerizing)